MQLMAVRSPDRGVARVIDATSIVLAVAWLVWAVCSILANQPAALTAVGMALLVGNAILTATGAWALLGYLAPARRRVGVPFGQWFALLWGTVLAALPVGGALVVVAMSGS